jgi:hypothetical protein
VKVVASREAARWWRATRPRSSRVVVTTRFSGVTVVVVRVAAT